MKKPRKPKSRPKSKRQHVHVAPRRTAPAASAADIPLRDLVSAVRMASRRNAVLAGRVLAAYGAVGAAAVRSGMAHFSALSRSVLPEDGFGPWTRRMRTSAALALPYSADDRDVFALVFLPFLLFASAMVISQTFRRAPSLPDYVAQTPEEIEQARRAATRRLIAALPIRPLSVIADAGPALPAVAPPRSMARAIAYGPPLAPSAPQLGEVRQTRTTDVLLAARRDVPTAMGPVPSSIVAYAQPLSSVLANVKPAGADISSVPPAEIAMLDLELPSEPSGVAGHTDPASRGICEVAAAVAPAVAPPVQSFAPTPQSFGFELAQAAQRQIDGFVIYDDTYRTIRYPMGDVPPLFGVCTDVIVRAYRALGFDLQTLVHQARTGSGDTNIDHRRTEVLRRFFTLYGESLPVTSFAEDYLPGDIVTYYRPQNRHSRSHIAMVSAVTAPSGRPMIIHNRGWGPQLEDGLFVDEITGHYRYYGGLVKREAQKAEAKGGADAAVAVPGRGSKSRGLTKPVAYKPAADTPIAPAVAATTSSQGN